MDYLAIVVRVRYFLIEIFRKAYGLLTTISINSKYAVGNCRQGKQVSPDTDTEDVKIIIPCALKEGLISI